MNSSSIQPNRKLIIGVDLGGTKIRTGVVANNGQVIGVPNTLPTGGKDRKELILQRIIDSIDTVIVANKLILSDIEGIGIGSTGPLDPGKGLILEYPQLPTMHFYPLREQIIEHFHVPVYLNNDANALILAESIWGAAQGCEIVLGFTLGTGFGCALVLNRKLHMGATDTAGEIWLAPYKDGIIEDYVSGKGISRLFMDLTGQQKSPVEIAGLARGGNHAALETWKEFGEAVAFAISWSVNLIDPDIVILGGSIAHSMDLFYDAMFSYLHSHICPAPAEKIRIAKASLGDDAGFMGSAALVMQEL